jgi:hypothetical protein
VGTLRRYVVDIGARADRRLLVAVLVLLNATWLVILGAIGAQFERTAGVPLLDLQNSLAPADVVTPSRALAQIATYPPEAVGLYWSFFVLDGVMPPLVFGCFALLWANLLHHRSDRASRLLLGGPLALVPLGVGAFDWVENLAYVSAISAQDPAAATTAMVVGLVAKWIKAVFLQLTFLTTLVVVVAVVVDRLRRRARRPAGDGADLVAGVSPTP